MPTAEIEPAHLSGKLVISAHKYHETSGPILSSSIRLARWSSGVWAALITRFPERHAGSIPAVDKWESSQLARLKTHVSTCLAWFLMSVVFRNRGYLGKNKGFLQYNTEQHCKALRMNPHGGHHTVTLVNMHHGLLVQVGS